MKINKYESTVVSAADHQVSIQQVNHIRSVKLVKQPESKIEHTHRILRGKIIESVWEAYSTVAKRYYYAFCMSDGQIIITITGMYSRKKLTDELIGKVKYSRAGQYPGCGSRVFWTIETDSGGRLDITPPRYSKIRLQSVKKLDGRRNWKPL